jgi:hypothetical protein
MAYLKPAAVTSKLFNPLAMRLGIGGSATLSVARRTSGTRYVVSTRGESQWVKNLRRAVSVELRERGSAQRFTPVEIPVAHRAPILDAYRAKAGRMVDTYWKRLPDPADHPTFRLDPPGGD